MSTHAHNQRRRGALPGLFAGLFGERDNLAADVRALQRHGAGFRKFARFVSYLMLVGFSAQGVIAQVRPDAMAVFGAIGQGAVPDLFKALTVFVVGVFVLGLDIMIIAEAEHIRHELAHGVEWGDLGGALFLLVVGGAIEGATYVRVVVATETPATFLDWLLLLGRATMLPVVVVVLATLTAKPFSVRDFQQLLGVRLGHYVRAFFDGIDLSQADAGELVNAYASVTDLNERHEAKLQSLSAAATALSPESQRAEAARVQQEWQRRLDEAQQRVEAAERLYDESLSNAQGAMRDELLTTLLHIAQYGTLPEHVQDMHPALAGFNLANLVPARTSGRRVAAPRQPKTRAQAYELFLAEFGIEPAKQPEGSRKVWLRSGDVGRLVTGTLPADRLRRMMRECGKDNRDGTSYIAPVDSVVRELSALHMLCEPAQVAWQKLVGTTEDTDEDTDPNLRTVRVVNDIQVARDSGDIVGTNDREYVA